MSARPHLAWIDPAAAAALTALGEDPEDRPAWQDSAACAEVGDDFWFPEKGGSTKEAKRVCRTCEVRTECLEYALATDQRFGIWGGLSERERRRLKRGEPVPYDPRDLPVAS